MFNLGWWQLAARGWWLVAIGSRQLVVGDQWLVVVGDQWLVGVGIVLTWVDLHRSALICALHGAFGVLQLK